jgi:hypothetical protein
MSTLQERGVFMVILLASSQAQAYRCRSRTISGMSFEWLLSSTVNQHREGLKIARKSLRRADHAVGMVTALFVLHNF